MSKLKKIETGRSFRLENGEEIEDFTIAYHSFGTLNEDQSNVVWVFHAISGSSDVLDWWPGLFGEGRLYDPAKHFIICANTLGSPYGSTCPEDLDFPQFSMRDVVKAHLWLADHLGIQRIHTAIGPSFGGDQALEFTYAFKGKIDHLVAIASCARESAWGIAIHESQRLALESDPTFGHPEGGRNGMRAARSMAMLTYRTSEAFIERQTDSEEKTDDFNASSYIRYQGEKFVSRFDALCYHYLTKCLDSHNIGRGRGGEIQALSRIRIPTLVIGIGSDTLIPVRFQKFMVEHLPNADYAEITSEFGHDGFLVETDQVITQISNFYEFHSGSKKEESRAVLKFGGKSLSNDNLDRILEIVKREADQHSIAVVVSARGSSTDQLLALYEAALESKEFEPSLYSFFEVQQCDRVSLDFSAERKQLTDLLTTVSLTQSTDAIIRDRILAFGEIISAKTMVAIFNKAGLSAEFKHAGELLQARTEEEGVSIQQAESRAQTQEYFNQLKASQIPVITGFIANDEKGRTRTLGRNGTNYSATLIASYVQAKEVQNWTDVDGVYSANPSYVDNAVQIAHMSYKEANELANFGANILHAKTIQPLINSDIPLRILNARIPERQGTLIDRNGAEKGIKAVSVIEQVSLVRIEGRGLLGRVGIDGRIFSALSKNDISVRLISQASSERGIGFVVDTESAAKAEMLLQAEFRKELQSGEISTIEVDHDRAIIAIVGRHNYALEKAIQGLRRNRIWMHLISNSISGEHISLVINSRMVKKALRVVHSQVMGATKVLNVFALGKGTVGGKLIDQIIETNSDIVEERNLLIRVVGVADSQRFVINEAGLKSNWRDELAASEDCNELSEILRKLKLSSFENLVVVDNTSSQEITEAYPEIVKAGFDIAASNKKANSISYEFYAGLRKLLKRRGRTFYYETNVGAGLPVIDTLKHIRQSADSITRIRGVFSGSLSYLFNTFSASEEAFSEVLLAAKAKGFTEPDPREDLSGMDVARKLVILAREVGMTVEFEDVQVEGLIPDSIDQSGDFDAFMQNKNALDAHFEAIRASLNGEVLRYVGELDVPTVTLKVSLQRVSTSSPLGGVKNADSIFEIYTKAYGDHPMVIQGAGAGAEVTARGVYSDLLRMGAVV